MEKEYETYNHAKTHIRYHLIFCTKYRKSVLDDIKNDAIDVFQEVASCSKFKILHIGIDGNHIHLMIKSCPSISILQIVKRIKTMTTQRLWKRHPEYLSRYYWKKRVLWTRGYFCSTVGEMSEDTLSKYINNQG